MIVAALLAAAAPAPQTAVDAERAFAAMAQAKGQWTAFRHFAAPDATMFVPERVTAQEWLKDRKDPSRALQWSPTASFVSCDGTLAVNTGDWRGGDSVGFFTTIWQRKPDGGWHWLYDGGDTLSKLRDSADQPVIRKAACNTKPTPAPVLVFRVAPPFDKRGLSADGTLVYHWFGGDQARDLRVLLWTGEAWDEVLHDHVAAPVKP